MKIVIACEHSGKVTKAFRKKGHDVTSCDILKSKIKGKHHKGSILDILNEEWDMMIGFPPCTYLSYAGKAYWNSPGRITKRLEALEFFRQLWEAPIKKICLENPLGIASQVISMHDQIIEPYFFGDPHRKRTCLFLKNLPKLVHYDRNLFAEATHTQKPQPMYIDKKGQKRYYTDGNSSKTKRSIFWNGIAEAMADQWG